MIEQEKSTVDWKPSIHKFSDCILHIVGGERKLREPNAQVEEVQDDSASEPDDSYGDDDDKPVKKLKKEPQNMYESDIIFVLHNISQPYWEISRTSVPLQHFTYSKAIHSDKGVSFAFLYINYMHKKPSKVIRLTNEEVTDESSGKKVKVMKLTAISVTPSFEDEQTFKDCSFHDGQVFLFTNEFITIFDNDLEELYRVEITSILDDAWEISQVEPMLDKTGYLFMCFIDDSIEEEFKDKQSDRIHQVKEELEDGEGGTMFVKCTYDAAEFNYDENLGSAFYLKGEYASAFCQIFNNKLLVQC